MLNIYSIAASISESNYFQLRLYLRNFLQPFVTSSTRLKKYKLINAEVKKQCYTLRGFMSFSSTVIVVVDIAKSLPLMIVVESAGEHKIVGILLSTSED